MRHFVVYCFIGAINTLIGFGTIFLLTFYKIMPEIANFLGYCIGIICSFSLNNFFTFQQKATTKKLLNFFLAMGISYAANLTILLISYRIFKIDVYLSQILAGIGYTAIGFILSKFYVWRT